MPGSEKQNTHVSVIHYFPDDLVEQADGKTQTWTLVVTGSTQREPKSFGEYENVVQIARCSLPDVEGIEEIMIDRLLNINPAAGSTKLAGADNQGSWHIHAYPEKSASIHDREPQDPDISNPMSGSCFSGVFCTQNFITIATMGGEIISIYTECIEWTYLSTYCGGGGGIPYYPPGSSGGGGGSGPPGVPPGGDGSPVDDPCHIDTNDPNQPPQAQPVECLNDPCDWLAPPVGWMCGDTCQTNDSIIDDTIVQAAMHEAWQASYGPEMYPLPLNQRKEKGGWIVSTSNGYEVDPWPSGWTGLPCGIAMPANWYESAPSNTIGMVHTHPFNVGDDVSAPDVCGPGPGADDYQSSHSLEDWEALVELGDHLNDFNVKGYIIDGNNIVTYGITNHPSSGPASVNTRCGY